MNPAREASLVYLQEPCGHTFWEALDYYLAHGFVHSTPEFFVMARPVSRSWPEQAITNPMTYAFPENQSELTGRIDSWHIALMAGSMAKAWDLFPYPLRWISLERENDLRFYDHERFRALLRS